MRRVRTLRLAESVDRRYAKVPLVGRSHSRVLAECPRIVARRAATAAEVDDRSAAVQFVKSKLVRLAKVRQVPVSP